MISVLLVDDQDLVRLGLRTLLDSEEGFTVAGEARDGLEATRLVSTWALLPRLARCSPSGLRRGT